jgi:hypothetical protein
MSDSFLSDLSLPSVGAMLPAILTGLGAGTEFAGNETLADNARLQAQRQAAALQFQQRQLTVNAGQAIAAGQYGAAEQQRQGALIQSRAQALAAASGAGAVDPTVVNIIGHNAGEIALRANMALYQGEEQARQLRMAAAAKGYDAQLAMDAGDAKAEAYGMAAKTALFKGAGSMFAKYGFGQPKPANANGPGNNDADLQSSDSWDTPAWQGSGA